MNSKSTTKGLKRIRNAIVSLFLLLHRVDESEERGVLKLCTVEFGTLHCFTVNVR